MLLHRDSRYLVMCQNIWEQQPKDRDMSIVCKPKRNSASMKQTETAPARSNFCMSRSIHFAPLGLVPCCGSFCQCLQPRLSKICRDCSRQETMPSCSSLFMNLRNSMRKLSCPAHRTVTVSLKRRPVQPTASLYKLRRAWATARRPHGRWRQAGVLHHPLPSLHSRLGCACAQYLTISHEQAQVSVRLASAPCSCSPG